MLNMLRKSEVTSFFAPARAWNFVIIIPVKMTFYSLTTTTIALCSSILKVENKVTEGKFLPAKFMWLEPFSPLPFSNHQLLCMLHKFTKMEEFLSSPSSFIMMKFAHWCGNGSWRENDRVDSLMGRKNSCEYFILILNLTGIFLTTLIKYKRRVERRKKWMMMEKRMESRASTSVQITIKNNSWIESFIWWIDNNQRCSFN